MKQTKQYFSEDFLINKIRESVSYSLKAETNAQDYHRNSNVDCVMNALAMFTFKFPTMLLFDEASRAQDQLRENIQRLFGLKEVLSDTRLRERLDLISPDCLRKSFTRLFALLQRAQILDHFRYIDDHYLVSLDGTGYFSSPAIHCEQCCEKVSKSGKVTYYHQMLAASLVHPEQEVVYPFAPEPILKQDGTEKNDCERNAAKRWLEGFRREHPHLKVILVADGLFANAPFIKLLKQYNMHYIIVCQEKDHKYLIDRFNAAESPDAHVVEALDGRIGRKYKYMNNVLLNGSTIELVNVLGYWETKKKGEVSKWMWVTDIELTKDNIKQIMIGGRSRWRIENETFNTLKTAGYNFEHNYGHGYKNLSCMLATLMMLSFYVDQMLQGVNKLFIGAYKRWHSKRTLWEMMRAFILLLTISSFEELYSYIIHPPTHGLNRLI